jgi:hypothetical protein
VRVRDRGSEERGVSQGKDSGMKIYQGREN